MEKERNPNQVVINWASQLLLGHEASLAYIHIVDRRECVNLEMLSLTELSLSYEEFLFFLCPLLSLGTRDLVHKAKLCELLVVQWLWLLMVADDNEFTVTVLPYNFLIFPFNSTVWKR